MSSGNPTAAGNPNEVQSEAGPSSSPSPSPLPSGFESWRTSLAQFTGLGLSEEQQAERARRGENDKLAKDWDRCEKWKKDLLERSTSLLSKLCMTREGKTDS